MSTSVEGNLGHCITLDPHTLCVTPENNGGTPPVYTPVPNAEASADRLDRLIAMLERVLKHQSHRMGLSSGGDVHPCVN